MIYGYCRISKATQNIERQIQNILKYEPDAQIIKEAYTGTKVLGRKAFEKLLKDVKQGDTIIFDSVSRMSRNADEGLTHYFELYNKGVTLVFIKEPYVNTETYNKAKEKMLGMTGTAIDKILNGINEYLIELQKEQIKIAFEQAEKEVTDLHQRTKEGIKVARDNGKQIGRAEGQKIAQKKQQPIQEIIKAKSKDFYGGNSDSEVIAIINNTKYTDKNGIEKTYHISRNTYYKYKKDITE